MKTKEMPPKVIRFTGQTSFYRGKVRDVHTLADGRLVMVASDRISAFDHILPRPIPHKGQVLNQLAAYFLEASAELVPNWFIASPDPNVTVGYACTPIRIEMVIRGYLSGHAARTYASGSRKLCGVEMPEGMRENDPFPEPIITPAIKSDTGHDEDISKEEILQQNVVSEEVYETMEKHTKSLFSLGSKMAAERGLILVDTKYEFGLREGEIMLMDEIHTPDSSRYFYMDGYNERQIKGEPQQQLSKEFVRQWLIEQGFQGLDGQKMPEMSEALVEEISQRYIRLYEELSGQRFIPAEERNAQQRIYEKVENYLLLP
jgi:phosphoribosylaminoimidazole-succinocarboxamide synthase